MLICGANIVMMMKLLQRFKEMTEQEFKKERGYYGKVGDRTVIKNSAIIKDVLDWK